jgi:hypothetical protein
MLQVHREQVKAVVPIQRGGFVLSIVKIALQIILEKNWLLEAGPKEKIDNIP